MTSQEHPLLLRMLARKALQDGLISANRYEEVIARIEQSEQENREREEKRVESIKSTLFSLSAAQ